MKSRKDWLILLSPSLHNTNTHKHTHAHTHTLTHTHMHRKALEFKCIHCLRKNAGRRTSKDKKSIQEVLGNRSVCSLLLWAFQTKQGDICICLFVCFFRSQKLITPRWVIAILCLFLILSKLKSITLDYVSFICQPSSYHWRKTVLNHCGFFGLPFMSLLHEAHGKEPTRFLNAWNWPQSASHSELLCSSR